MKHLTMDELEAGLAEIRLSPKQEGRVELIVCRPQVDQREVLEEGKLDLAEGLLGDNWRSLGCAQRTDGTAHPETQLTLINSRVIALIAQTKDRWPLAGDQLYLDLDLSRENLPPGTQLAIGSAVIEITAHPHAGCKKYGMRFGKEAVKFVNSALGRELCLRGIKAKIVQAGVVRPGDVVQIRST